VPNAPSKDFRFLAETSNLAAVDLLDSLLDSSDGEVRTQAAVALSLRKDSLSIERLIRAFARTIPIERQDSNALLTRVMPKLLEIVENPKNPAFRGALQLIAHGRVVDGFPRLVRAAEQVSSPHGVIAGKCLIELAVQLGSEGRSGLLCSSRETLVKILGKSLEDYASHRSNAIPEALMVSAMPDDAVVQAILKQNSDRTLKILVRLWKTTTRQESLDLLILLCGRQFVPRSVLEILLRERKDSKIAKALAQGTHKGISSGFVKRIRQSGSLACFAEAENDTSELDKLDRWQLWKLMAAGKTPIPKLFEGISLILDDNSVESQEFVADILREYRPPGCRAILKAMAPNIAFDNENIPEHEYDKRVEEGVVFRRHLTKLIAIKEKGQEKIKKAVEEFFYDFTVNGFVEHLDILIDDALKCFGGILTLVHERWYEALIPMLQSSVPKERCKAAIAAGYLGPHPGLRNDLTKLLTDPFETIQEEASFALKQYPTTVPAPRSGLPEFSTATTGGQTVS
jgi:hypothetical protein